MDNHQPVMETQSANVSRKSIIVCPIFAVSTEIGKLSLDQVRLNPNILSGAPKLSSPFPGVIKHAPMYEFPLHLRVEKTRFEFSTSSHPCNSLRNVRLLECI